MSQSTTTEVKMQTLRCAHGDGHNWTRPSQRGKPPAFCPAHKGGTPAPQKTIQTKVAQANAEIASIDAEQAAKLAKAREAAAKAREERKAREAREAAESKREELARITATIDDTFRDYEAAFDKANRTNKPEDWRMADSLQSRCIGMRTRQRALEAQVSV